MINYIFISFYFSIIFFFFVIIFHIHLVFSNYFYFSSHLVFPIIIFCNYIFHPPSYFQLCFCDYLLFSFQMGTADTHVNYAKAYLDILAPTLADRADNASRLLRDWDLKASRDSLGCTVFHRIHRNLHYELFGKAFGRDAWRYIMDETPIFADFSSHFDRVLLSDDALLFGGDRTVRNKEFGIVAARTLDQLAQSGDEIPCWGSEKNFTMTNVFFSGQLPPWLGFDSEAPVLMEGASCTVVQGALVRTHGRDVNWGQSWRFVTDLATRVAHTSMPGGPSGRRWSPLYQTNTPNWIARNYSTVALV